jgi:hypothetical protein
MKNSLKEMITFKYAWGLYRDNISKKSNGGLNTGLGWTVFELFFRYLKKILL